MNILIRSDHVEISGYVNAVERPSKILHDRSGDFIETMKEGAFKKALARNDNVRVLLNHDRKRDLGGTKDGNLELEEDNIGLRARAKIYDKDVIDKARKGDLVGWSFGFTDRDVDKTYDEKGLLHRAVKDLDLEEVSILDRTRTPAYKGTLIMARDDKNILLGEEVEFENVAIQEETPKEETPVKEDQQRQEEQNEPKQQEIVEKNIDYSKAEEIIKEIRELKGEN